MVLDFQTVTTKLPKETRDVIYNATCIYTEMMQREVATIVYDDEDKPLLANISDDDKFYGSLFLALLLVDSNVKNIMNRNGVFYEDVLDYFKANDKMANLTKSIFGVFGIKKREFKKLNEREYEEQFYMFDGFGCLLLNLMNSKGVKTRENLCLAFLTECLVSADDSKIIDYIYLNNGYIKVPEQAYTHSSFDELYFHHYQKQKQMENLEQDSASCIVTIEEKKALFGEIVIDGEYSNNTLQKYGDFLTEKTYHMNPIIGREEDITALILGLLTPEKSVILTGEPGVGKTAIVEGLAYLISNNMAPKQLVNKKIVKINMSSLLSGTVYRGMFEERIENVLKEAADDENIILFIDEIHTVMGAGRCSDSSIDASNILKPYLDRGQIKVIGATTTNEYHKYIAGDGAFKRRFERVHIEEPSKKLVTEILSGSIPNLELITGVEFSEDYGAIIINNIVNATDKKHRVNSDYTNNPDLALTILKKTLAIAVLNNHEVVLPLDAAAAIEACDRLNKSSRTIQANQLLKATAEKKEAPSNVLQFRKRK